MKYGVDYGVKVDWEMYTPMARVVCRIPLINLFFTQKLKVNVTCLRKGGGPLYGVSGTLRFPKSKLGLYNIICCPGDKDCLMTVEKILVVVKDKNGNEIASTRDILYPGEDLKWTKHTAHTKREGIKL